MDFRGRQEVDRRKRLAARVFETVADVDPVALELLAAGLGRAGGPWAELGGAFAVHAGARAAGEKSSQLAVLKLARWLRHIEAHDGPVFERLTEEDAGSGDPWAALRTVLLEQREHGRG